ncbi:putative palmitoyltransferase ZDHHC11 [Camelus dromedarius]|uniref:Palmitoyltransferase n=1 Tax=Camelus dromedarius TaxID=9838 RepID=A0A5N4EBH4_CAMDR|nr:putative palmitoyltransferase ZDHHC11 [Camelus dromedarius]
MAAAQFQKPLGPMPRDRQQLWRNFCLLPPSSQDLEEPTLAQISSTESSKERPPAVVRQMPFCARSLRRVIPEASAIKASQTLPPRLSRVNGWSRPLHFFQAIAWAMFLFLAFTTFGVFIPFLPPNWRYIAYGVTGGLFLFHFLVHVIAVSIDPADTNVRMKKNYAEPVPTFDRSKYLHVIQNRYCHLCEVTVSAKAKHCSYCNKCVEGFDHHCKWLNNCVGTRNYWFFFSSVASAFVGMLCVAGILLYIFIQYVVNPVELRADQHYRSISNEHTWVLFLPLFPTRTKTPVVLTLGASMLLLNAANLLLLGHLLFFHLYLMNKKLSTYDYVIWGRQQRNLAASQTRDKASQVGLLQVPPSVLPHRLTRAGGPGHLAASTSSAHLPFLMPHPRRDKSKLFLPSSGHLKQFTSPTTELENHSLRLKEAAISKSWSVQGLKSLELLSSTALSIQPSTTSCSESSSLSQVSLRPGGSRVGSRPRERGEDASIGLACLMGLSERLWWPQEAAQELAAQLSSPALRRGFPVDVGLVPCHPSRMKRKEFLSPSRCPSSVSSRSLEGSPSLQTFDETEPLQGINNRKQGRRQPEMLLKMKCSLQVPVVTVPLPTGAEGPALAECPIQEPLSSEIPSGESALENLPLPHSLQDGNQDVQPLRPQDALPGRQECWVLETTVIYMPKLEEEQAIQETPRGQSEPEQEAALWATRSAQGLRAAQRECGIEMTSLIRLEQGCPLQGATKPGDTTSFTVITMPKDSEEPRDGPPPGV